MIVAVQEIIEHSRDITAEMVRAYLERRAWVLDHETAQFRWYDAPNTNHAVAVSKIGRLTNIGQDIMSIANSEGRKPHEVLTDIAEGR